MLKFQICKRLWITRKSSGTILLNNIIFIVFGEPENKPIKSKLHTDNNNLMQMSSIMYEKQITLT